jgi:hypothetical protein
MDLVSFGIQENLVMEPKWPGLFKVVIIRIIIIHLAIYIDFSTLHHWDIISAEVGE